MNLKKRGTFLSAENLINSISMDYKDRSNLLKKKKKLLRGLNILQS